MKRRKPIAPRSKKMAAKYVERRKLVARLLENQPECQMKWPGCWGTATQVHEPLTRGRRGSILDEANTMVACAACHRYTHDHVAEATERGYLVPRWNKG